MRVREILCSLVQEAKTDEERTGCAGDGEVEPEGRAEARGATGAVRSLPQLVRRARACPETVGLQYVAYPKYTILYRN